jgi:hypothetical protein
LNLAACSTSEKKDPYPIINPAKGSVVEKSEGDKFKVVMKWKHVCRGIENTFYKLLVKPKHSSKPIIKEDVNVNRAEVELAKGKYDWAVLCFRDDQAVSRSFVRQIVVGNANIRKTDMLGSAFYKNLTPPAGAEFRTNSGDQELTFEWSFSNTREYQEEETREDIYLEIKKTGTFEKIKKDVSSTDTNTELSLGLGSYSWAVKRSSDGKLLSLPTRFQVKREINEP